VGRLHFAVRNETFRIEPLKPLKSLGAANQVFRGFLCYQGLEAYFVSPAFSRSLGRPPLACQSAAASPARVEAAELVFHLADLVAAPLEYRPFRA
jgi:hypothetical protein